MIQGPDLGLLRPGQLDSFPGYHAALLLSRPASLSRPAVPRALDEPAGLVGSTNLASPVPSYPVCSDPVDARPRSYDDGKRHLVSERPLLAVAGTEG